MMADTFYIVGIAFMLFIHFSWRHIIAAAILLALLANPKRYEYIERLADQKDENGCPVYTNDDLTLKNIEKAYKIADQFIRY